MPRTSPEWIGKTDDTKVPPRVRIRVFDRFGGVCQLTGRKILAGEAWDCDHIVALVNGGEHREVNLQPVLRPAHREKTKADVAEKATINRKRAKHLGIPKARAPLKSRGFAKAAPQARATAPLTKALPPRRPIYEGKER